MDASAFMPRFAMPRHKTDDRTCVIFFVDYASSFRRLLPDAAARPLFFRSVFASPFDGGW